MATMLVALSSAVAQTRAAIAGRVVDMASGAPIRKVQVTLFHEVEARQSQIVFSDADGRFLFDELEPGPYTVWAFRQGFRSSSYGFKRRAENAKRIILRAGVREEISLAMGRFSALFGKVVDGEGDAISRAQVQLWRKNYRTGRIEPLPQGVAFTDDLGRFRVFGVPSGLFYLSADYNSRAPSDTPPMRYIKTFYPASIGMGSSEQIHLNSGADYGPVTIRLAQSRVLRVNGKIGGGAEEDRTKATVTLYHQAALQTEMSTARVSATGTFEFPDVMPGTYDLVARGGGTQSGSVRMRIEVSDQDVDNLTLTIAPAAEVMGYVNIRETPGADLSEARIALISDAPNTAPLTSERLVEMAGFFRIKDVPADRYKLVVWNLPAEVFVQSVSSGRVELEDRMVDLNAAGSARIDVVLSNKMGQVSGVIEGESGEASSEATVALIPKGERRFLDVSAWYVATSDESGRFRFEHVIPGEYIALAWDDIEEDRYFDPDLIRAVEGKGVSVKVEGNSSATVRATSLTYQDAI